jgi:hypothetical protein
MRRKSVEHFSTGVVLVKRANLAPLSRSLLFLRARPLFACCSFACDVAVITDATDRFGRGPIVAPSLIRQARHEPPSFDSSPHSIADKRQRRTCPGRRVLSVEAGKAKPMVRLGRLWELHPRWFDRLTTSHHPSIPRQTPSRINAREGLVLSDESFPAKPERRGVEGERGTGFEPATTSLEGWCSATELPPRAVGSSSS